MVKIILITILLMSTICFAQTDTFYNAPSAYTTYYHLRMWDEGDRPGADSINQNLKDIDSYLNSIYTSSVHTTGNQFISGNKTFDKLYTRKITVLSTNTSIDSSNKYYNRTDFMTEAPYCNYIPANGGQLANKYYVDTVAGTLNSQMVHKTGNESIQGEKTFESPMTIGESDGSTSLNFQSTDDFYLKWNGNSYLNYNGTRTTLNGNLDITGAYKVNNVTGYLTSGYGTKAGATLYVASGSGGSPTTELNYVTLTINGTSYDIIVR